MPFLGNQLILKAAEILIREVESLIFGCFPRGIQDTVERVLYSPWRWRIETGFVSNYAGRALTSHSGLALIGALMGRTRLAWRVDEITLSERPRPEVSHGDAMASIIGLLALGKPDFGSVEAFPTDPFY